MKDPFNPLALPHLKMFDPAQCEQIHLASLEVLRRTGVRVHEEEALALLKNAEVASMMSCDSINAAL